jgi:phosphatidylethanolamine/phosphatidyl-N-methylethanolamine N-methyltransferase
MINISFARTWLRSPRSTGALVPSSKSLATALVNALPDDDYDRVIELGTGEGSVTRQLVARFGGQRVVGIELDSRLALLARAQAPEATIIVGDACRLSRLLQRGPAAGKTAVVSCLPLTAMPRTRQRVLSAVRSLIAPYGHLVQFTYVPWQPYPARECRIYGLIGMRADRILRNVPPATVWVYRPVPAVRPRRGAPRRPRSVCQPEGIGAGIGENWS